MPRRRGLSYAERVPPLQTTPERFWVDLFGPELSRIPITPQGYKKQLLVRKFLSDLRITPVELEPGLIQQALLHHLKSFAAEDQHTLVYAFKYWASLPPCQPPSSDSESRRERGFARSPRGRIAAG